MMPFTSPRSGPTGRVSKGGQPLPVAHASRRSLLSMRFSFPVHASDHTSPRLLTALCQECPSSRRSLACGPIGCSTSSRSLRAAKKPVTAAELAEELEVTVRTIYRDVATLQARRVPIEGAPGLGYVLRKGFDLPPLMFTVDEIEAITVGARLVQRLRDPELQQAADGCSTR